MNEVNPSRPKANAGIFPLLRSFFGLNRRPEQMPIDWAPLPQLRKFLRDIHIMKTFAASKGKPIPEDAQRLIALLAALPVNVYSDKEDVRPDDKDIPTALQTAMQAHAALSKLVDPATPESIEYTEPPRKVREFWKRQTTICVLLLLAIASLLLFVGAVVYDAVLSAPSPEARAINARIQAIDRALLQVVPTTASPLGEESRKSLFEELTRQATELEHACKLLPSTASQPSTAACIKDVVEATADKAREPIAAARVKLAALSAALKPPPGRSDFWDTILRHLKIIFAAALGSGFYTLYTANTYMIQRTFDPSYTTHYVVRFFLGIVAGCLLANFVELVPAGGTEQSFTAKLTLPAFALLGGYSADAVYALLTRVVETLSTLVKGTAKEQAKAESEAAIAKAKTEASAIATQAKAQADATLLKATADADATQSTLKAKERERLQGLLNTAKSTPNTPASIVQEIQNRIDALGKP